MHRTTSLDIQSTSRREKNRDGIVKRTQQHCAAPLRPEGWRWGGSHPWSTSQVESTSIIKYMLWRAKAVRCRIWWLLTKVLTPENHISLPHDSTQVSSAFMMFGRKASRSESVCRVHRTPSLRVIAYYLIILNTKRFPIITIDYGTLINSKINY